VSSLYHKLSVWRGYLDITSCQTRSVALINSEAQQLYGKLHCAFLNKILKVCASSNNTSKSNLKTSLAMFQFLFLHQRSLQNLLIYVVLCIFLPDLSNDFS